MMRRNLAALLALLLCAAMPFASPGLAETVADGLKDATAMAPTEDGSMPYVIATSTLSEKFSPFFSDTVFDTDVVALTQVSALTTDRTGGIVFNAADGEVIPYNGVDYEYTGIANVTVERDETADTTTYTAKLKPGVLFSDGVEMTADDLIFSYYVYLDPAYVGSSTLNSQKIIGLQSYLTQIPEAQFAQFSPMFDAIYAAGRDHEWSDADEWTQEQQDAFWTVLTDTWTTDVQAIVDYVQANYAQDYAVDYVGFTPEEVAESEGLQVALGMAMWGFASKGDDGLTSSVLGKTWTLEGDDLPTIADYFEETYAAYGGDAAAYWDTEQADGSDVLETARGLFINELLASGGEGSESGVPNIAGIHKLDQYTVEVVTNAFSANAIYQLMGIEVSPMHYYGDPELYDYDNNQFGHPYGDLSIVQAKTSHPVGAGPYKFVKYENKIVYYEANEHYYQGAPLTKYLQYKETTTAEVAPGIQTGTIDAGEMSGSKANMALLAGYNSNGEPTGDVVTNITVENLGYGYIGMNADTVKVGENPFSEESKNLRKALATVLAVYRDVSYDTYYGEAANVINYPISNTSWAAPQSTDEGYKVAFSVGVDGADLYTSDMTQEAKYAVAIEAAKQFLISAGFEWDEETSLFTAAPEGAKLEYEVLIPADGAGDHPSFAVLTDASAALASLGITLKINDPSDSNILWDTLDAGTQELWCAAWASTIDPDMYQIYHSSNIVGLGGSDSNHYHLALPELDELIIDARTSADQAYRKAIYKQALDIIVDAAVEVPAYQRLNMVPHSTMRVDIDTLPGDITTYYGPLAECNTIMLNANK